MTRHIGVVTGSRAEYDLLYWLLKQLEEDDCFRLSVIVTGSHPSPEFGSTANRIYQDGWTAVETVEMLLSSGSDTGVGKSIGLGVIGMTDCLSRLTPDILVVLGDRYEILASVQAAMVHSIPVGHISGGDVTEGVMDELIRHAVTKMSHLHFAALPEHGRRLMQMGEEPWRVHTVGELNLDAIRNLKPLSRRKLEKELGVPVNRRTLVVTFHPETPDLDTTEHQIEILLAGLNQHQGPVIFTYPNADAGNHIIKRKIGHFCSSREETGIFPCLGQKKYLSLLTYAGAMVGNSSSGIVEAPSFHLPFLHVGQRQLSRVSSGNIICVPFNKKIITQELKRACSTSFRRNCAGISNPYGDGRAAEKITQVLGSVPLGEKLFTKRFFDIPGPNITRSKDENQ